MRVRYTRTALVELDEIGDLTGGPRDRAVFHAAPL